MRRIRSISACLLSILFLSFGLLSCQQSSAVNAASMAPKFSLKDMDGKTFDLSDTKGKVVIVDFWATWCPPCRMEIPHFQSLYEEYKDKGLVVVGVALDRSGLDAVKSFVRENRVTYPVVMGNDDLADAYGGIRGIPTTFVLDREGRIVEKYVGYRDREVFEDAIKPLL
ncbi:MAG: redoxin domain-containing protein [Candidatus Omnitrophota bacterium]